ncbi:hypothetical protein E2562_013096 [Oryza meyeriana var. granulata]|uniref:Uncharacterized protein n=1 Tax=Oryza meyeriana var. granulata TaxID=110450 RepID=A0A6G1F7J5_9ORYZ|nr:hypothetical protein E2562_013096 [Oryza meyeriana var. granulata]
MKKVEKFRGNNKECIEICGLVGRLHDELMSLQKHKLAPELMKDQGRACAPPWGVSRMPSRKRKPKFTSAKMLTPWSDSLIMVDGIAAKLDKGPEYSEGLMSDELLKLSYVIMHSRTTGYRWSVLEAAIASKEDYYFSKSL